MTNRVCRNFIPNKRTARESVQKTRGELGGRGPRYSQGFKKDGIRFTFEQRKPLAQKVRPFISERALGSMALRSVLRVLRDAPGDRRARDFKHPGSFCAVGNPGDRHAVERTGNVIRPEFPRERLLIVGLRGILSAVRALRLIEPKCVRQYAVANACFDGGLER